MEDDESEENQLKIARQESHTELESFSAGELSVKKNHPIEELQTGMIMLHVMKLWLELR
jgi:hypothetical protein